MPHVACLGWCRCALRPARGGERAGARLALLGGFARQPSPLLHAADPPRRCRARREDVDERTPASRAEDEALKCIAHRWMEHRARAASHANGNTWRRLVNSHTVVPILLVLLPLFSLVLVATASFSPASSAVTATFLKRASTLCWISIHGNERVDRGAPPCRMRSSLILLGGNLSKTRNGPNLCRERQCSFCLSSPAP